MNWKLGLNFYSDKLIIFDPTDLDSKNIGEIIQGEKYHIYIICKRKKMFFERSVLIAEEGQYMSSFYYLNETHDKVVLHVKHTSDLKINSWTRLF